MRISSIIVPEIKPCTCTYRYRSKLKQWSCPCMGLVVIELFVTRKLMYKRKPLSFKYKYEYKLGILCLSGGQKYSNKTYFCLCEPITFSLVKMDTLMIIDPNFIKCYDIPYPTVLLDPHMSDYLYT